MKDRNGFERMIRQEESIILLQGMMSQGQERQKSNKQSESNEGVHTAQSVMLKRRGH